MKPTPRFDDSSERSPRNEELTALINILLAIAVFIAMFVLLHLAMSMLG